MRLHRFFIEEQLRNKKDITLYDGDIIHQLKDVFRLKSGSRLILLDNTGFEYICEIVVLARGKAEIKIVDTSAAENIPTKDIWLFAALIKKDNFEWILEKCTELGVSHFVPILSERTEKKDLNIERANKIIQEASEQSGRGKLPELQEVMTIEEAINFARVEKISSVCFHTDGENFDKEKILNKQSALEKSLNVPHEEIPQGIFIGPEGGWSDREVDIFKSKSIPVYNLGKQVLRAETAAIAISSLYLL